MRQARMFWMMLGAGLLISAPLGAARKGGGPSPAPDRIEVIAHVPLSGGPVTQLTTGTHWQRNYLYAVHATPGPVAILDVTDPAAPANAGQLDVPQPEAGASLSAVVGTAALITSSPPTPQAAAQTVTVLSFADPAHPTVARHFSGVTSMLQDNSRNLIYLGDSEGVWVLRVRPAPDIQSQKEYAQYVFYDR